MRLRDFKGLLNKYRLQLLAHEEPHAGWHVFDFTVPNGLHWQPGQHITLSLPGRKLHGRSWRTFSIASTPAEGMVRIAIHCNDEVSDFKQALCQLAVGEHVSVRGPIGWFTRQEDVSPIVMVANDIAITAVRALLKDFVQHAALPVTLIYISKDHHLFQDEFKQMATENQLLNIHLVRYREKASQPLLEAVTSHGSSAYYYLTGSPQMIRGIVSTLRRARVTGKRVFSCPFHRPFNGRVKSDDVNYGFGDTYDNLDAAAVR